MNKYAIGLDFGTNSCRSLIVNLSNGDEISSHVFNYPSGQAGVIINSSDPNQARQNPSDYLIGIEITIKEAIKKAIVLVPDFSAHDIVGIGVDTTGSSPLPVDENGTPLCFIKKFENNPSAMVWLWKDHTSYYEAQRITEAASKTRPEYLSRIGGIYSSEWYWSKIWHCSNEDTRSF